MVAAVSHLTVPQQGKLQKHQAFEAEVQANSGAIVKLDETGNLMISEGHFASETIRVSRSCACYWRPSGLVGGGMWIKCQFGFLKKPFLAFLVIFIFRAREGGRGRGRERPSSRFPTECGARHRARSHEL